jgi:hypothetical protein
MRVITKPLGRLFETGVCPADDGALDAVLTGLAHPSADGARWVISRRLLDLRHGLAGDAEAIAAVLATQTDIRTPWLRILAARCREAGQLADANALVQLVSRLDAAAGWVEAALPEASLNPSPASALERELFGSTAEQSQATPALTRCLAAAARLVQWQQEPLATLTPIEPSGERVDTNWCRGRLLAQPQTSPQGHHADLLSGTWSTTGDDEALDWALRHPWPLLLATIGYVQDAWSAEARGGLLLELPAGQYPHQPSEIQVLVADDAGNELLCGSLGGFVLGLLSRLGLGLFPAPMTEAELNGRLSPLVGELLRRRIWRFQEGLSGQQGLYLIHPAFSDATYQIKGTRSLGLHGRGLRRAIREQAEQWRIDRRSHAPIEEVMT